MKESNAASRIKKTGRTEAEKESAADAKTAEQPYRVPEQKSRAETRENICIMTMLGRKPRQIMGHAVSRDNLSGAVPRMADAASEAGQYRTDGYRGYPDVVCPGGLQHPQ